MAGGLGPWQGDSHTLLSPATSERCPMWLRVPRSLQQSWSLSPTHVWQPPGPPAAEWIFMLSPGFDISVDQSNISQVFSTATGMRSFGLGVLDVEKLLLGGGHAAVPGA